MSLAQSPLSMGRGIPKKALLVLAVGVALVHAALLEALPHAPLAEPVVTRAFTTRSVALNQPEASTPAPPSTPKTTAVKPRPRKVSSPASRPAATAPVATPGPQETAMAAPAEPDLSSPAPEPAPLATAPLGAVSEALAAQKPASAPDPALEAPQPRPPREAQAGAAVLSIPGSTRLKYDVFGESKKMAYRARADLLWLQDGQTYDARLVLSAFLVGSRSQTSSGTITSDGLAPTRFADKWRGEVAAHFEREKGRITFSANTPEAPLLNGAQDRLSVLFQLVAMLAGDPKKYPVATTLSIQTVGPRDAEVWLFTVDGEETLHLGTGEVHALKLSRNPRREFDQKIEVWFAPALGYLPVRFKITQANGDFLDQRLLDVEKP